ncbi:MAG: hypothetical protein RUMPE_00879 [Eubacteriales bacterium SKADARSKE-1]|nr:hypothetical protein [Eubacteriales bacterium SKADARSKE-1]
MDTYEEILTRMQNKFSTLAGFSANEASDIGIRLKVLAGEIFSITANFEWLKNQLFTQTASGSCLDLHATERGLSRKTAISSEGTLTFSRTTALGYDVEIPRGTVCATSGVDGIRFETTETVTLTAGDLSIDSKAQSVEGGSNKNTGSNTITVMITPPAGITAVTNDSAFTGGIDAETDEELRERIIESYKNISNGTNIAFYKDEILKYDGIYSVSVVPLARGAGTVDIYVAGKGAVPSAELIATIQSDIEKLREINVDIEVKAPTLVTVNVPVKITVEPGYIFNEVKEECLTAINNYFNSLAIGEQVIFAAIGNTIFQIEGVKNYSFESTVDFDKVMAVSQLAVPGTVSVTQST